MNFESLKHLHPQVWLWKSQPPETPSHFPLRLHSVNQTKERLVAKKWLFWGGCNAHPRSIVCLLHRDFIFQSEAADRWSWSSLEILLISTLLNYEGVCVKLTLGSWNTGFLKEPVGSYFIFRLPLCMWKGRKLSEQSRTVRFILLHAHN